MIDINKSNYLKYFLFSTLYLSEGMLWATSVIIMPVYLINEGISVPITTLVIGIIMTPVIIKFFWGGLVDYFIRVGRRNFILIGGITSSISLFVTSLYNPVVSLIPFTLFLFISHCGIGFLDVSADAWAIEISNKNERGKINGVMFGGMFLGFGIGSVLLTKTATIFNYNTVFIVDGLIVIFAIIFPLIVKETKKIKKRQKIGSLIIMEFKRKIILLFALFAPLSSITGGMIILAIPIYMTLILDLDLATIGLISLVFPISNVIGSLIGGAATDIYGRKKIIAIFVIGGIVTSPLLILANSWIILAIIYSMVGFIFGGIYSSGCAIAMDITNPKIAATEFSILTSFYNFGEILMGNAIVGIMIAFFGFTGVFLYASWFSCVALLVLYFIRPKK